MIKTLLFTTLSAFLLATENNCNNKKASAKQCYKGKLVIKGICSNYTIQVLDKEVDAALVEKNWTDEHTGKSYTNVFGLREACSFPASLNEGDEFYFTIDSSSKEQCNVCMAYYPTPAKKLPIKVLAEGCK